MALQSDFMTQLVDKINTSLKKTDISVKQVLITDMFIDFDSLTTFFYYYSLFSWWLGLKMIWGNLKWFFQLCISKRLR